MTWEAIAEGAAGLAAVSVVVGQVVRRSADSANRYLRDEIRQQTGAQTDVLTARINRLESRTSLVVTAAAGAAAGAAVVVVALLLRSIRPAMARGMLNGRAGPGGGLR